MRHCSGSGVIRRVQKPKKKKKHAIIITDMKLFSKHLKTRHINLEESVESLTRRAWGKTGTVLGVDRGKKRRQRS